MIKLPDNILENFFSEWVKKNKPYRTTNQYSGEDMMLFGKAYEKEQLKKVFDNYGIGFIGKAHHKHDFESWYKDFHKSNSLKPSDMKPTISDIINRIIKQMNQETERYYDNIFEYYVELNKRVLLELNIPLSDMIFKLIPPSFSQKNMNEKAILAHDLKAKGYSIREVMRIMGYKSPRSVQDLLNKNPNQ